MLDKNATITKLIGKPYQIGARGPDFYDCYGLVRHVQMELAGISMPNISFAKPTTRAMAEEMLSNPERKSWEEIDEFHIKEYDLILMGNVAKRDFHLGVFIIPTTVGYVLHTEEADGVRLDDIQTLKVTGFNHLRVFRRKGP